MKEWKYLVHFLYVFFYEHIFDKLYTYIYTHTRKIQYYERQDFNERRNNASTILTTSSRVYTKSHFSN
jgi:hypothetical protein